MPLPNYYYPATYQPAVMPSTMPVNSVPSSNTGILWVQGEASAKSYPVGNGQSVLLMDSEDSVFYIKSTDQSGMPMPLRVFDYSERKTEKKEGSVVAQPTTDYVSRDEFEKFKEDISKIITPKHVEGKTVREDVSK